MIINDNLYKLKTYESIQYIKNINVILLFDIYSNEDNNYVLSHILYNNLEYITINQLYSIDTFIQYINKCKKYECSIIKEINNFIN